MGFGVANEDFWIFSSITVFTLVADETNTKETWAATAAIRKAVRIVGLQVELRFFYRRYFFPFVFNIWQVE